MGATDTDCIIKILPPLDLGAMHGCIQIKIAVSKYRFLAHCAILEPGRNSIEIYYVYNVYTSMGTTDCIIKIIPPKEVKWPPFNLLASTTQSWCYA